MKSLKWLIGITMLLVVFSQVQAQEYQKIFSIKAEAFRDFYIAYGSFASSSMQYTVKLVLKNTGQKEITYDEIKVFFSPKEGTPLRINTHLSIDQKPNVSEKYELFRLKPGESDERDYSTNGYTSDLLRDAGNDPLMFAIVFVRQGKVVAGPYRTFLPQLQGLPDLQRDSKGKLLNLF